MCAGGSGAALSWRCRASVALKPRPWPFCPLRVRPKVDSAGAGRAVSERSRSIHSRSGEDAVDSEPRSRMLFRLCAFRLHAVDADRRDDYSANHGSLYAAGFMDALALISRAARTSRCSRADLAFSGRAGPAAACAAGSTAPTEAQAGCSLRAAIGVAAYSACGARSCHHSGRCRDAGPRGRPGDSSSDGHISARPDDLPDIASAGRARPDGVQAGRIGGRTVQARRPAADWSVRGLAPARRRRARGAGAVVRLHPQPNHAPSLETQGAG